MPQQSFLVEQGTFCWQHTPLLHVPEQAPQVPPQPSDPQFFPAQLGVQQAPALHTLPVVQVPQVPPQPSDPQVLPTQLGWH
jgi:hypothetical protein